MTDYSSASFRGSRYALSHRAAPVRSFDPHDFAGPVLAGEPSITDENRADLFDLFHAVPSTSALAGHLNTLNLPPAFKRDLLDAKNKSIVQPAAPQGADKVLAVVKHIAAMDPQVREMAEAHPKLLNAILDAQKEQ